ncbi:hypothetical protein BS47DRAFT_1482200 [Hydnum rufescens UP504]|uniref:Uncharacterized protein n=1 Tax=Hydnum rufescens UP504 TaxID=1448309 RepID=A0A9P6B7U2_9AGAM|nr:hypothetical protein BS47DRAFT_1482200 [Hydnum rufescens UP504]
MTEPEKRPLKDVSSPATSPPPKRHEAIFSASPMSPSHDVLPVAPRTSDDATPTGNTAFDDLVLNEMAEMRITHPLSEVMAPNLLNRIVFHASGRLNQRYQDLLVAGRLIQEKPELFDLLSSAFKLGRFGSILEHPSLQTPRSPPTTPRPPNVVHPQIHEQGDNIDFFVGSFLIPYFSEFYSNSVAIIQSSGTGKSRMVDAQSDLVFTLPFNLRPDDESKAHAFPPPDPQMRNYLCQRVSNLDEAQTRYLHVLGHLFREVTDELSTLHPNKVATYEELAMSWRKHLETDKYQTRARIYEGAVKRCTSSDLMAKDGLERLIQCIDGCCMSIEAIPSHHVKLMLYFDEAHVLSKEICDGPGHKDVFHALCSSFNYFIRYPIFVIYLSTNSDISYLAPKGSLARSARARENPEALQAPVTETPFDCSPRFPIVPGAPELKLEHVCSLEFMAQFGRPLFWSLLNAAGSHSVSYSSELMNLARAKLINHTTILGGPRTPEAGLAVTDVLLHLDFEPRRQVAHEQEAGMVASHMRFAFSIPEEPGICSRDGSSAMAQILRDEFSSGLLDQGQRGEVVFRLLLSEAYRRAVRQDHPDKSPLNFSQGAKLTTFIKQLFSAECAETILECIPDNVKSPMRFASAFEQAIVRFTHFGKMADDTATTSYAMLAAFVRCMAVIGWDRQETVDILIPILLRPKEPLAESVMSGILIQVKRREQAGTYQIDQTTLDFFPDKGDNRPYVTLIAELGIQGRVNPQKRVQKRVIREKILLAAPRPLPESMFPEKPSHSDPTPSELYIPDQPKSIHHPKDVHARYSIFAYGCSSKVYGVVSEDDRGVYRFLLGNSNFLDEHPRQDVDSLGVVKMMKPFWTVGVECYHWIQVPFLHAFKELPHGAGSLLVGEYDDKDYSMWEVEVRGTARKVDGSAGKLLNAPPKDASSTNNNTIVWHHSSPPGRKPPSCENLANNLGIDETTRRCYFREIAHIVFVQRKMSKSLTAVIKELLAEFRAQPIRFSTTRIATINIPKPTLQ